MCEITKRRNVELDVTYKLVSAYDPEYFELKQKYDELCKAVLEGDVAHSHYLAEKGETN